MAREIARLVEAARAVLEATGGNAPEWMSDELVALEEATIAAERELD